MSELRVVDTGFGNVKGAALDSAGNRRTIIFPSGIEADGAAQIKGFQGSMDSQSYEIYPVVDGVRYRVFTDAQAVPRIKRPAPSENFQSSPEHVALTAVALHALGPTDIDLLVLGTPVHTWRVHREQLKRTFTGACNFGLGPLRIAKTLIFPQPYGSLVQAHHSGAIVADPTISTVILDPGWYSLDGLTASNGLNVDPARSHGVPFGMHALCTRLADFLERDFGLRVGQIDRIDYALRTDRPLRIGTKDVNLRLYLPQLRPFIREGVNSIKVKLGSSEDAQVVVTGGGSPFFIETIREAFPKNLVVQMRNPIEANLQGFLVAAQAACKADRNFGAGS